MYQFPIKYYEDNMIFNEQNKDCWACYKVKCFNYDFLSTERKINMLNRLTRFIANVGSEAKILMIPVAQDTKKHYANLINSLSKKDPLYDAAKEHAVGTQIYLDEMTELNGSSNDYEVYVVVKISKRPTMGEMVDQLFKRPIKTLEEFLGVERREILLSEKKSFEEAAEAWYREENKRLGLIKTDAATTQWLIKRMLRRGISESVSLRKNKDGTGWKPKKQIVIKDGEKAIRPLKRDILTLTEGMIEPSYKYVKVTNSDGKVSYQTFLTMAHIPDGLVFPGSEWLLILQDYSVACEVCMHIKTVEFRESIRKISGKRREIKSQIEHVAENDSVPDDLFEASQSTDELESELKKARDPLTEVSIAICIANEDANILEDKATFIKQRYEDANFMIERPMTDQFKLFMEFIPGAGRYVSDYVLPLPPQTVAGSMFAATRMLGDTEGPFIGTTGVNMHQVFLNMARACLLNRSASAALLGTLGGGKSFNANLLAYLNVLYGGAALIFDPKGERSNWIYDLPELSEFISIITLSVGEEDVGKLDPFLIYRDNMSEAGELAQNIICELFKIQPKDKEYTVLLEAIKWVKENENPCMSGLAEYLRNFPETDELKETASLLARKISIIREAGMAKLLFGTGKEKGLSFKNRLNILQIQNLQMPDPSTPKEDYTQEEILSSVLMLPIASFAKKFAMSDKSIFKLVLFDESWALSSTQMGIKLMNALARMGRSLNAGCIFIGHSVTDLKGDGIKNAITYKFCFKTTEINEIKRVLSFLDLEETDDNIKTVMNLGNGQCLFQDLDGRVGILTFDAVYEHLIDAFNTTPNAGNAA
ncbi:ATP-binding protein [Sinanaerobacter sp. ZZT-01]|uniref:ATP-binding protein n=1 Tax=Sinanaerobacter sp. ZZT-01 TaxID=3111540 RepID=UPI002D794351|nr:ATP-binding protein [Sinanaerobacter sp. ZZT-01]WRR94187.1 ATP-binding protein [Sinanaerobacter sp. ZZT-01]